MIRSAQSVKSPKGAAGEKSCGGKGVAATEQTVIEHCPLTTMELPAMDPWMDAADGRGDGAADTSGGERTGRRGPGGDGQRARCGDAPVSDGAASEGAAGDMEQAAMEQTAMKQTAMEQAAMAMRQGQWPMRREARCSRCQLG